VSSPGGSRDFDGARSSEALPMLLAWEGEGHRQRRLSSGIKRHQGSRGRSPSLISLRVGAATLFESKQENIVRGHGISRTVQPGHLPFRYPSNRAGKNNNALINANTASTEMPIRRKGSKSSQTTGNRISASTARGQQSTSKRHQAINTSRTFIAVFFSAVSLVVKNSTHTIPHPTAGPLQTAIDLGMGAGQKPGPVFEDGKDAFHRVPDCGRSEWDAVERVLTRFRGARRVAQLRAVVGPQTPPGGVRQPPPCICNIAIAPRPPSSPTRASDAL
jgi:hypothetical protein